MSFVRELKRRNVFRVGAAYVVTAWLLIQVAETLFPLFGFDETPARIVVIVLAAGLFPALIIAWAFEVTPEGIKKEKDVDRSRSTTELTGRRLDFVIIGMLALALGYFALDKFLLDPRQDAAATAVYIDGLAEVRDLVGEQRFATAYSRARELTAAQISGPFRDELWEVASRTASISSDPPGAQVWVRAYNSSEEDWEYLGSTPIEAARVPLGMGRLKFELEGYRTLNVATWYERDFQLDPVGALPEGMVRAQGKNFQVALAGLEHLSIELPDYLIDVTEVTNAQYQHFVDAGGYENPDYWDQKFVREGRELSFDEAMALFEDKTSRPGPSTWEVGMYPNGMAAHPVGGVSWYEAAAFARFAGKELPTVFHWYWAANPRATRYVLPHSNFGGRGTVPVGTSDAIGPFGTFDMAGNVREWIWNESKAGRFLFGGGWRDPEYMFVDANAQSPFDRNELNGIRLMIPLDTSNLELARRPVDLQFRDYAAEHPVTEDIFDVYRSLYGYDPTPLNTEIVAREEADHWTQEKIELDSAYGDERLVAYLYLPRGTKPPYSPIVYFPGSNAIHRREIGPFYFPFLLRAGYAVLVPVYKGTYSRGTELATDVQDETISYREHVIAWSKDLGRSLDYLETRPDIVMDQLVYFGLSWGAAIGPVMIAMEPRIKTGVLVAGGLVLQPTQPEVDPFNFLSRVKVPTLMINMPTDYFYPLQYSQKPFFNEIGTEDKIHVVVEGGVGHVPPMNIVVQETLEWFEQHLGAMP